MNRPEDEEDDEQVMAVPESFEIGAALLFNGCPYHPAKSDQHDVSRPTWASDEIGENEAHEAKLVLGGEASKVVPMSDGVTPGEEEDGPSSQLVEGDVLV